MRVSKDKMNILGEKYSVIIITELYERGGSLKISDFLDLITNYRTIEILSKKLQEEGLIEITELPERYPVTMLSLTEKGKEIAPVLAKAIEKL